MKSAILLLTIFLAILSSCEGRTGYLNEGQQSKVSMLTDVEWLMYYSDYGDGYEYHYDNETKIYKFDRTGKGWVANGSFSDISLKDDVSYYKWSFTTENFAVIYMAGHIVEGYWLIEKLNSEELWVQWTMEDPVIYPNQNKDRYRFKARKTME